MPQTLVFTGFSSPVCIINPTPVAEISSTRRLCCLMSSRTFSITPTYILFGVSVACSKSIGFDWSAIFRCLRASSYRIL